MVHIAPPPHHAHTPPEHSQKPEVAAPASASVAASQSLLATGASPESITSGWGWGGEATKEEGELEAGQQAASLVAWPSTMLMTSPHFCVLVFNSPHTRGARAAWKSWGKHPPLLRGPFYHMSFKGLSPKGYATLSPKTSNWGPETNQFRSNVSKQGDWGLGVNGGSPWGLTGDQASPMGRALGGPSCCFLA